MEAATAEVLPVATKVTIISLVQESGEAYAHAYPDHLISTLKLPDLPDKDKGHNDASRPPVLTCSVSISPGVRVQAWAVGPYVFIGNPGITLQTWGRKTEEVEPFIRVEALGTAFHKTVQRDVRTNGGYYSRTESKHVTDTYGDSYDHNARRDISGPPWNHLRIAVTVDAAKVVDNPETPEVRAEIPLKFQRPEGGDLDLDGPDAQVFRASATFFGLRLEWDEVLNDSRDYDYRWPKAHRLMQGDFTIKQGRDALWARFLAHYAGNAKNTKGLKATLAKKDIRDVVAKLQADEPLLWSYLVWLHDEKARGGISNNTLLAVFLDAKGKDLGTLKAAIRESMTQALESKPDPNYSWRSSTPNTRSICLALPGAKDKDEEKRSKKEWYLRKSNKAQAEGIGVSEVAHPKLMAAIEAGDIPLGLFHKSGDQLHLINVEFDLWERALERKGWSDVLFQIAKNASARSTYEKNVTPYLAFLFRIEKYLDRHTGKGKKWQAFPSFVNSEWQLEMDEATEDGTVKKRSALTPIPDNEARTITVPYVAMRISGVRTTFCYSLDYQVFEEHTIDRESGTPIVNELERKLNGRDDYGLMYYTLTGTPQNTGYPAFLIILERRKTGTFVHFHRVHPCRSKEGKPTPACRLVEECYRYMAGNIRAEEIYAQQGDLIFIKTEQTVEIQDAKRVKEFESHAFKPMEDKPILLIPNEAKSIKNRLGFIYSEGVFMVDHPEHEPIKGIPAGVYEVRRCKSWEANPKAVWSYTID